MVTLPEGILIFLFWGLGVQIVSIKNSRLRISSGGIKNLHSLSHVIRCEVCVLHCHTQVLMPKQLLDGAKVNALHDQVAGKGVSEVVEPHMIYACSLDRTTEVIVRLGKRLTARPAEHVGCVDTTRMLAQEYTQRPIHRYGSRFVVLGMPILAARDLDDPSLHIHIVPTKSEYLSLTHPGIQRGHHNAEELRIAQ